MSPDRLMNERLVNFDESNYELNITGRVLPPAVSYAAGASMHIVRNWETGSVIHHDVILLTSNPKWHSLGTHLLDLEKKRIAPASLN